MRLDKGGSIALNRLAAPAPSNWKRLVRGLRRLPVVPGSIILMLSLMAVFAPLLAPGPISSHGPLDADLRYRRLPPQWQEGGSSEFRLGADLQGRDVLSRIIHGARVSLTVAAAAITLGMAFGTAFGLISGYFGGLVDEVMMRVVEIFLAVPLILIALVIVVVAGASYTTVISVLVLFSWVQFARQVRGEVLSLKELDYVALARVAGAPAWRILLRHIFPGVVNTMTVVATLNVGGIILTESVLSYLGAGIPPPTPAWGAMVADGRNYLAISWWIAFFPGMAIFLTVMAFNFLGDWLRDALDPRLRQIE